MTEYTQLYLTWKSHDFFRVKLFNFRIVLEFQKNCEDSAESSHIFHTQFPLFLTLSLVHWSQLMNQYWHIIIKPIFIQISLVLLNVLFLFQDPIQDTTFTFSCHVSLGTSCLWQILRFSLFWMNFRVFWSTSQIFCRISLNWDLPDVFVRIRLGLWI